MKRVTSSGDVDRMLPTILFEVSARLGAALYVDQKHGQAGYIEFSDGNRCFFKGPSFDINPQGASSIAKDKDYCAQLLRHFELPVPDSVLVFSPRYRQQMSLKNIKVARSLLFAGAALDFAEAYGFPLFVKPNEGSEGRGVMRVMDRNDLLECLWSLSLVEDRILVQRAISGRDYRVVVLGNRVLSAYERRPLNVVGDGQSSIAQLINVKLTALEMQTRSAKIEADDLRIGLELRSQGYDLASKPAEGKVVYLLPNANLSTGGDATDITDSISHYYRDIAVRVASNLGLALAGVDIIADDLTKDGSLYHILEVNSAPGLNNYAGSSEQAGRRTRELYAEVLRWFQEYHSVRRPAI
jgi:D-alanine-D-alanine ligase-like ATP-grasp enzyme